jgi:hypothetical protein
VVVLVLEQILEMEEMVVRLVVVLEVQHHHPLTPAPQGHEQRHPYKGLMVVLEKERIRSVVVVAVVQGKRVMRMVKEMVETVFFQV